jgi:hypothetical protein
MNKKRIRVFQKRGVVLIFSLVLLLSGFTANAQWDFKTNYLKIHIDNKGFITSLRNSTVIPNREFTPMDKPSPLLCLYNYKSGLYFYPEKATWSAPEKQFKLSYNNGSVAIVNFETHPKYFKLTLLSLTNRKEITDIQWGSFQTNITNLFGEVIGVARDTSDAVNYAIGVLALNDITTGGTSATVGDAAPFQYIIHSPDPSKFPLPDSLHEAQLFSIGGDGISDVAFFSHPETYFRILYGNSACVDNKGQIFITYHAVDRRVKRDIAFSLIPFMPTNTPNHLEVQPLPGVDYIGSSIALWGSPDSTALMNVIQNIVFSEKLPYPKVNGKWIKDPSRYLPDALVNDGEKYDSIVSYVSQMGFKAIETGVYPFLKVDRANEGYIDGKNFETKPFHFTSGDKSHKEFSDLSNPRGVFIGRHNITTALAPGTKDGSPVPGDSVCCQQKRILANGISATDTLISVTDPLYLDEISGWEGHAKSLNIIKIAKELIWYSGISKSPPYNLLNVKRGYWGTTPAIHAAGDTLCKAMVTLEYGYDGLIPDMFLQDKIAEYYADLSAVNGLYFHDFDGEEFLFDTGHGYYGVKRFFRKMFERADKLKIPYLRFTGATLSEGSWHYQSVWNVGGGKNMYDSDTRQWGSATSEGKDIRDAAVSNYFPATLGSNFAIDSTSTIELYEHVQAISVGAGATYFIPINQKSVERCPNKYSIFKTLRTWENARAANAFSRTLKKQLANPGKNWRLVEINRNTWKLYERISGENRNPIILTRAKGY